MRHMMRGYRILKNTGRLDSISELKKELTTHSLNICGSKLSGIVFGAGLPFGELIIRQYLLLRCGHLGLNKVLLISVGKKNSKVIYAMPSEWFDVIENNGFQVNRSLSTFLWNVYVFMLFIYGVIKIGDIVQKFFHINNFIKQQKKPYCYFSNLELSNLPNYEEDIHSHNIISWYLQWEGKLKKIDAICHSVSMSNIKSFRGLKVLYLNGPLPSFLKISQLLHFLSWAVIAIAKTFYDLLRGRWWHTIILNQAASAAQARIVSSDSLANDYFFHNSTWIYRPLWTYEIEKAGSQVHFYFYSTNIQSFNANSKCMSANYGWNATNWTSFMVWDSYQRDFVLQNVANRPKISVVKEIWWSDNSSKKIDIPKNKTIAVFDVEPHRDFFYQSYALNYEYYIPNVAIQYLNDIKTILDEFGLYLAIKQKRKIGNKKHPKYESFINEIEKASNVIVIPSSVAASRLIDPSIAVISMPFTSTALLGLNRKKPSIYYDSGRGVVKDDCAAHGIEVIFGKDELRFWVKNTLKQLGLMCQ